MNFINKEKLIIIGANEFQEQLVIKAKEMGYETHVFAWEDGAVARDVSDYFYPISIIEKEEILKVAKKINPAGVISIASEVAAITVNYLADNLGLIGNNKYCSIVSTNKYEMRKVFLERNLPSPEFKFISKDEIANNKFKVFEIGINLPFIVKPVDRSGSRGVSKVENKQDIERAIKNAIDESFGQGIIIEEFVEGNEYSMEMISFEGKHYYLATTKKYTTGSPHFIETMHSEPSDIEDALLYKIIETIKNALDALDIKYGASHSEFKVDKYGNFKIIEIGARMGGDCIGSDLVKISNGNDFTKLVIDVSVGKKPILQETKINNNFACVKFIFNENDLDILKRIQQNYPQKIVRISRIEEIGTREVKDSSTRFGYFIMKCSTREEYLNLTEYKTIIGSSDNYEN